MRSKCSHMELCCMSAFTCSLKLAQMRTDILTSHVGITCGDMKFTSLGGYKNEWIYVLTGELVTQLSSCIDEASSCQVGISPKVYENLSHAFDVEQLNAKCSESGNFIIDKVEEGIFNTHIQIRNRLKRMCGEASEVKLMRRFVPRPVLHAIMYGTVDTISELLSVTTVFLKLDSYCTVANADPVTLQPFFEMAQRALGDAGGFLRQFLIDDKGCVLIAMWGVPSYTFKNNNARAVSFALNVHRGTLALNQKCSIGVTSGKIFCGNVGSLHRRDYVGIGATVNLAARLMGKSKGRIFVDEETAAGVTSKLPDMQRSDGMKLKGYSELVYAYILNGTESFELSTKGTVSSTYVQAGVTKQVMVLLNNVSSKCTTTNKSESKAQPLYRSSTDTLLLKTQESLVAAESAEAQMPIRRSDSQNPLYNSLPCPDVENSGVTKSPTIPVRKRRSSETSAVKSRVNYPHCMVVEAQSGGGKSAVALLFESYSSKCAMPSYIVKLKTLDRGVDHCVFRKLFMKVSNFDENADDDEQKMMLRDMLALCDWPNRPSLNQRVAALSVALGLAEDIIVVNADNLEQDEHLDLLSAEDTVLSSDVTTAVRDIMYFLLGQRPCSVIIEHGHFADSLSWADLHYIMECSIPVAILVTARIGSVKDDFSTEKFESLEVRQKSLKDFQRSLRPHNSDSLINRSPVNDEGKDKQKASFHHSRSHVRSSTIEDVSSRRRGSFGENKSHQRSVSHFFDMDEPAKEIKIAYDRAHYTESYEQLISHERTQKLQLPQLEMHEIGHLFTVDLHWHENDISQGLLEKMYQVTHGNSYWCKELAHYVSVRGQDSFIQDPVTALGTVVVSKVNEKLTMEQQITVKVASVIGYVFSLEVLKLAVPRRVKDFVVDSIMYLSDHNFLTKLNNEPPVYCFPNSIIKNVLHDLSPPSDRAHFHLLIAQQIEGINEHNLEPYYEM